MLTGMTASDDPPVCDQCGSSNAERLIGRVARLRGEDQRIDEFAGSLSSMGEPSDHAQIRRLAKEMGSALDDSVSDEMEQMFEDDMDNPGTG